MTRLFFYFSYAYKNIRRGGRWTALAIFCIAAGVATVVALRGLGLSIGDALVSTVRQDNKGDIRLTKASRGESFGAFFAFSEDAPAFTANEVKAVENWVVQQGGTMTAFTRGGAGFQVAGVDTVTVGRPQSVGALFIDPATYPPTEPIRAIDPANVPLQNLFTDGLDIVISDNLAKQQNLKVGDTVRVSGTEEIFTVRGIVATSNEAGVRNLLGAFFGFAYVEFPDARVAMGDGIDPNTIGIALPGTSYTVEELDQLGDEVQQLASRDSGRTNFQTSARQLEMSQDIAQMLGDFIVVLGLGALLIGGVGIMNTMLVMVRRRTIEIAALKTLGLKGRQVALLFLAEGMLFGLAGSLLGSVAGVLLGGVVNRYGETFLQQPIPWKIYPEALLYGVALGMIISVIFGLAPILTALQVRPGIVLRPNENHMPRTGVLQTLFLMLVVTLSIGLVVGQIIRPTFGLASSLSSETPYLVGIIAVALTLMFLAILVGVLWVLVWLIGKIPSFGSVTLHLALRNLSTNRLRTATTLLALSAGMFALSSITYVGEGTRQLLNVQLVKQFGGNVLVFPLVPGGLGSSLGSMAVDNALRDVPGIESRTTLGFYGMGLIAVDGEKVDNPIRVTQGENGRRNFDTDDDFEAFDPASSAPFIWGSVVVWESTSPDVYANQQISAGRTLTPEDNGKRVVVGPAQYAAPLGIEVGSILTYDINGAYRDYEVVGLVEGTGIFGASSAIFPPDSFSNKAPDFELYTLNVAEEHLNEALVALSTIRIPPTFALDVSFLDSFISRLITQFAAIPTIVGILSLFAAAVIMANTVALATLERQRQIGILKSIGLKSRRVLLIMLIESGLIGILSAVLGIGLSSLFVTLLTGLSGTPIPLPTDARLLTVVLALAALVIAGMATFLSAGVAVRERVMNVLRYE
jgi:putative ABC transport system permease protein